MAFGLGFNKAKLLAAAEKLVMQGKIPAALEEYQKILEKEPRDLVILNTVGDLCLRLNKTEEAFSYFYKLGEAYVEDGFIRNAIAVFKKITRADSGAIAAVTRLADLYTMQGQLNESRSFYNQAVDYYAQRGDTAKCTELVERLYLLDTENLGVRQRLASLYEQVGRKEEAASTYLSLAEGYADRASPVEAEKAITKARDLGSKGPELAVLQARILVDSGRGSEAIDILNKIPDKENNKAALNLLFHAYMGANNPNEAGEVAAQIFEHFDDFAGLEQVCAMMLERHQIDEAVQAYARVAERLVSQSNTQPLIDSLKQIITSNPKHIPSRELLCKVYEDSKQTGEFTDASEQLADVVAHMGDFQKAHDIYAKLAKLEPTNSQHRLHMQQMDQKMGRAPVAETKEGAPAIAGDFMTDLEAAPSAPPPPAPLDPQMQELLDQALTESDLQQSYKQHFKAIEPLEKILPQLPVNITLNQRLESLYEQTSNWKKAAERCEILTEAFVMSGDGENATRYGDKLVHYKQLAEGAPDVSSLPHDDAKVAEFQIPESDAAPEFPMMTADTHVSAPEPAKEFGFAAASEHIDSSTGEAGAREVDLSGEWESLMAPEAPAAPPEPPPPPPPPPGDAIVDEIQKYLQSGMADEAALALERLRAEAPNDPRFKGLADKVAKLQAPPPPPVQAAPPPPPPPPPPPAPAPAAEEELALDLGAQEEGGDFELSLEESAPAPARAAAPPAAPPAAAGKSGMDDLLGSLDSELADLTPPPPPAAPAKAAKQPTGAHAPAKPAAPKGGLSDVFAEFKEEMEVDSAAEADVENHYNMGVAFKEMALWDEAIGEFQKAYNGAAAIPHYANFIPCCSLLAHCFIEKNLPELAVTWLEKALKFQDLDREGEMALRYEIGSAQEAAGHKDKALESFMQVYAMNIDYRDVADRISSLKAG